MLLKIASLAIVAVTTNVQQLGPTRAEWLFTSGVNKGYVCAVMQQNGSAYDVYVAPTVPVSQQSNPAVGPLLTRLPMMHFATEAAAVQVVNKSCPNAAKP